MAQVAQNVRIVETESEWIDKLLFGSITTWRELPEVASEFSQWSPGEREDYLIEWNLEEAYLNELKGYAAAGKLTRDQQKRYERLQGLVARNRPIITRLVGPVVNAEESRREAGLPPIPHE